MAATSGKIDSIQALRGLAACAVVFFHSVDRIQTDFGKSVDWMASLASLGPSGVDLFFLISGFLMTHLHASWFGQRASATFLRKRFERIIPLYWLLSAFALALLLAAPQLHENARELTLPWLLGNFLFFPWPQPSGKVVHAVMVGWTLDYEMYFYLLFALAMLWRRGIALVAVVLTASYVTGLMVHPRHPWLRLLTDGLLLEFLAGVGIALLVQRLRPSPRLRRLGALLMVLGIALWLASLWFPQAPRQWKWGIPLSLVFVGTLWAQCTCEGVLGRILVLLGEASYSIYLFQVFALALFVIVLRHVGAGALPAGVSILALCALSCLAGVACWRFLERPLGRWVRSGTARGRAAQAVAELPGARSAVTSVAD